MYILYFVFLLQILSWLLYVLYFHINFKINKLVNFYPKNLSGILIRIALKVSTSLGELDHKMKGQKMGKIINGEAKNPVRSSC